MFSSTVDGTFGQVVFTPFEDEYKVPRATEQQIADFEAETDLPLPDDYKAYLLSINGGKVSPRGVAYRYTEEAKKVLGQVLLPTDEILTECVSVVRTFDAIEHPKARAYDLRRSLAHVKAWGRPGLLGIAQDTIGDFIVLDLNDGDFYGSVHYLTIQGVAPLVECGEEVPLGYIAPNFTAFTKMFFDYDAVVDVRVEEHLARMREMRGS